MLFRPRHVVVTLFVFTLFLLVQSNSLAQSGPDAPGEIMFVGFNADGDDGFAFVLLEDAGNGFTIYFTDDEWDGISAFNGSEGIISWTNNTGITIDKGTVVSVSNTSSLTVNVGELTNEDSGFDLGGTDEILYAYIGSSGSPTAFLCAISNDVLASTGGSLGNTELTTGTHHIEINGDEDVMIYVGDTMGTATELIANIGNSSNWTTYDGSGDQSIGVFPDDLPSVFTIQYPGGFGEDLRLWVKADVGVTGSSIVNEWLDQSVGINGLDTFTATTLGPELLPEEFNFHPALSFDRSNSEVLIDNNGIFVTDLVTDLHIYAISKINANVNAGLFNETSVQALFLNSSQINFGSGGDLITTASGANTNEPFLWTFNGSTTITPSGDKQNIRRNGLDIGNNNTFSSFNGLEERAEIGSDIVGYLDGIVSEFVVYTGVIDETEQQRIESYLSLKYGITLDQTIATDYLASEGTTEMWDKDALNAATYNHDIAGIGRDDASGLAQIKAQSQNTDGVVIMEAEGEGTNASPSFSDIDDLEFLTWGNNDGTAAWTTSDAPAGYSLLNRKWSMQEVGDIGTVKVAFDTENSDYNIPTTVTGESYYLVIDTDNDGTYDDETPILLHDDGTNGDENADDNVWSIESIDFTSGQSFSIASENMYPGNVSSNLRLWLKGGFGTTGTSNVTAWSNQIDNTVNDATATTGPELIENDINFNHALSFDAANDEYMTITDGVFGTASYNDLNIYIVARSKSDNITNTNFRELVSSGNVGAHIPWSTEDVFWDAGNTSGDARILTDWGGNTGDYFLWSFNSSTTTTPTGQKQNIRRDGTDLINDNTAISFTGLENDFYLGIDAALTSPADMNLAEFIVYTGILTQPNQQQIESYLGLKYGITLPSDYLASDGDPVWDASVNSSYNSDIAGIGRDDASGLAQSKSKSINSGTVITIALDSLDAPGSFTADDSWLVWGHDGTTTDFGLGNINNASTGTSDRMNRVWRVDETGTVGKVQIAFDDPTGLETLSLVVHPTDPSFPNDNDREVHEMEYKTTDSEYRVFVDLEDGEYFSIASGPIGGLPGVLITEVVTDPQQDWSTDEFHNPSPDAGTIDSDDEWIELFITEDNLNLTGWTIELNDGSDISDSLLAGGAFTFSNYNSLTGGLFLATDSGDYLILGNANGGDMDDVINIILRDANGDIVDQVDIGTPEKRKTDFIGISTGIENESVSRFNETIDTNSDSTDFVLTQATLGTAKLSLGTVLINEIVTDPQTDWSENDFDGSDGGNTPTPVDEWIELYIATDDLDLTNWVMDVENGANDIIQQDLSAGGAFTISNYFSETGGTFTKTDSGDYLVLGNAAENLINSPEITLYDPSGNIIDQVVLGGGGSNAPNGNADEFDNEAIARYPNATDTNTDNVDFIQTRPTLGSTNSPTGKVVINEVVTDPFRDWDTNGFYGTYTETDTDLSANNEWIELYITEDSINLSGWTMTIETDFTDGEITASGPFTDAIYFSSNGGSFTNTRIGDYYVLGNPTDNMTNSTSITLKDATGTIVDEVKLGGGPGEAPGGANASIAEESVARIPNGMDTDADDVDFAKAEATLGVENFVNPLSSPGYGLDFDGTDEYVDLALIDLGAVDGDAMTIEAWVKPDNITTIEQYRHIARQELDWILAFQDFGVILSFGLETSDGYSELDVSITPGDYTDGNWHHIAAVYDGTNKYLYSDGVLIGTEVKIGDIEFSSTSNTIGSNQGGSQFFDGQMDEIRFWSDARTHEEILENMFTTLDGNESNLVAYYNFDQSSGTTLHDLKGSNDGTLTNMDNADWVTTDWDTFVSNAAEISAASDASTSDELTISNDGFLQDAGDFILVGHENSDFTEVTSDLPSGTLVTARYNRSWHLTKNDVVGTANGNVQFSFDIGATPNSDYTYYLLERSGTSGAFSIVPIASVSPSGNGVVIEVDAADLTDGNYYTLGRSNAGVGNALDFDAASFDEVMISDDPVFETNTFTFETWFYVNGLSTGFYSIAGRRYNSGAGFGWNLYLHNPFSSVDLRLTNPEHGFVIDYDGIAEGVWHHVAVVSNGASGQLLYLDGILVGTTTDVIVPATGQDFVLSGLSDQNNSYFEGSLDEVRYWSDVRTQQEIVDNMYSSLAGDEANLVAYYRMNQGIGDGNTSLPDLSGNGNSGTLTSFDNLGAATASSNYVTSDRSTFSDVAFIINTDTDILTDTSGELTITSTTSDFLQDTNDQLIWGHDGGAFLEVATDLPTGTLVSARMNKTWHVAKNDEVGTADGNMTFSFDLGSAPNADYTYYLLTRTGTSGNFSVVKTIGSKPNGNSVEFTIDGAQLTSDNYFTLGRSNSGGGNALDFDGTDDYVLLNSNTNLENLDAGLTLEAWIYPSTSTFGSIIRKGGDYAFYKDAAGRLYAKVWVNGSNNRRTISGPTGITANNWYHVAFIWDGSIGTFYVNGLATTGTSGTLATENISTNLVIGGSSAYGQFFTGQIDEVRIWSDVRSASEIEQNMHRKLDVANESNLVAYYKFDQGDADGTNTGVDLLTDHSGNDNSGDLTNFGLSSTSSNWVSSTATVVDAVSAQSIVGPGNALDFDGSTDGTGDLVNIPALDVSAGDQLTIEAWLKPDNITTNEFYHITRQDDGSDLDWLLAFQDNGTILSFGLNANSTYSELDVTITPGDYTDGDWHHIAAVYDGTNKYLYSDGILIGTESKTGNVSFGSTEGRIGGYQSTAQRFDGQMDEVRFWSTARTELEIQENMYVELTGSETGLVAYYRFDELDATASTTLTDETGNGNDGTLTNMLDPAVNWVDASAREPFKQLRSDEWGVDLAWKKGAAPNSLSSNVVIKEDVVINDDYEVKQLVINQGAVVTINDGYTITVSKDLINNGSVTGDGYLIMTNDKAKITGGTVSNVRATGNTLRTTKDLVIQGTLDLNNSSIFENDKYNLTVENVINFDENAYILNRNNASSGGYVIKSLSLEDGDFVFPLGSNGSYTPLTVINLGSTGDIQARVFDDTYAQGTSGPVITTEKEVNKSWEINGDAGVNVTITLQWNSENEDPNYASARSTAYLSKNNYDWWRKVTPDVGVTGSDPYQITASGIQTFSVFGTGTEDSSLPVTWMAFEAFENEDQQVQLHWSTASELNNDRFEIEKSFDGNTFQVIGSITGNGTINSQSDYQFVDIDPFNGINYYRLRQVDYDGTDDYSELVSVFVDVQHEFNIRLSPNPTFDITTLNIEWENDEDYAVGIFDMMGRNLGVVHSKFSELKLDLSTLPKGMYIIKIHTGERVIAKKLIKN